MKCNWGLDHSQREVSYLLKGVVFFKPPSSALIVAIRQSHLGLEKKTINSAESVCKSLDFPQPPYFF